jgi:hypothetical protein
MTPCLIPGKIRLFSRKESNGTQPSRLFDVGVRGPLTIYDLFRKRLIAIVPTWRLILWRRSVPMVFLSTAVAIACRVFVSVTGVRVFRIEVLCVVLGGELSDDFLLGAQDY